MKLTQSIRRVLVIACMLAPLSVPGLGSAATISGTSCKREGSTRKVGDYEFVCMRSKNGSLRWRQQIPGGDPNRIVDNGYINIDGVRVSTIAGVGKYGMSIVERCGRIGEMEVRIWFNYADGSSRVERWIFKGKQVFVFEQDQYKTPSVKRVYVEASGRDPYGEEWTEENGFATTEWIWCANKNW